MSYGIDESTDKSMCEKCEYQEETYGICFTCNNNQYFKEK